MGMGGAIAGPFFGWYMLSEQGVQFSTLGFALIGTANLVTLFCTQPWWGRMVDRYGSKRVLTIGGYGVAVIPALFMVSDNYWYWLVIHIYDGAVWAAFGIAASAYIFYIVTPPKRARCIAYQTLLGSAGGLVGAFTGALLGMYLPALWPMPWHVLGVTITHPFMVLLALSTLLRLLPNILLLGSFREFRLQSQSTVQAAAR